ncbi:MAG: M28 family peptidase, partial [Maricaulaceae bacterium]
PLSFSSTGAVEPTDVVFAGFGLKAPAEGDNAEYDSYAHLDVSGKWVLVFRDLPNGVEAETRIHLSRFASLRYKAAVAATNGAAGVIFAPAPGIDYEDDLPALTYEASAGASAIPVVAIDGALSAQLISSTGADFNDLAETLHAGEMVGGFDIPATQISADIALEFEQRTGRNVLARLDLGVVDGAALLDPAPPLVIGAHVDHLGHGETSGSLARSDEETDIHFGADDNASGVASVIEIAQSLTADRNAGRLDGARDVIFAAWSGEELGLLGAAHFVDAYAEANGRDDLDGVVSAYLNLDMVGRLDGALILQGLGSSSVWAGEVERRNAVVGLPITTVQDSYLPTDATEFYISHVPILAAFTGAHEDYHSPRDTADKLNYEGMEQIARFMALIARSQATTEELPDYLVVDNTQQQGRVANVFLGTIPDYANENAVGVPISGVVQGGPADEAGLEGGDVIVGLGGVELANIYDYMQVMNGLKVGEATEVVVERDGERLTLELTPSVRE